MTPQHILQKTRRELGMKLSQMAEALDTSNQRVSQWENGDSIPIERIKAWATEERFNQEWIRYMAWQMWFAYIKRAHTALGEQMQELQHAIPIEI